MLNKPKPSRGRPRSFDRDNALEIALQLFWQFGYEGVSIAQLSAMMNINAPSLYAAFGSKEQLYQEVVQLYGHKYAVLLSAPLQAAGPVREALRNTLYAAARSFSSTGNPPGCLFASGMLRSANEHAGAAQLCAKQRELALQAITQRIEQAQQQGEIPPSSNSRALASLYAAVIQGMSVQAIDGASFTQLCELADAAMLAWPNPTDEHSHGLGSVDVSLRAVLPREMAPD